MISHNHTTSHHLCQLFVVVHHRLCPYSPPPPSSHLCSCNFLKSEVHHHLRSRVAFLISAQSHLDTFIAAHTHRGGTIDSEAAYIAHQLEEELSESRDSFSSTE
ncbi:hypothetical protein QVD17_24027 [Tagetes erecta]|uniref:Uncharacterized protein n=1 Tax=Tagetes erecta TaxID=13708 RepID=A0AAD8NUD7_TARER|nr:hypothetical protein QVD17_24027 [Tagetes erecta]